MYSIMFHSALVSFYISKQWNLCLYDSIPLHSIRFRQSK